MLNISGNTFLVLVALLLSLSSAFITPFRSPFNNRSDLNKVNTRVYGNGKPVEITFEPAGKVVMAEQGDNLGDVAKKAGIKVPYNCKQVRCKPITLMCLAAA